MAAVRLKPRILIPFALASAFLFVISLLGITREEGEHLEADFRHTLDAVKASYQTLVHSHSEALRASLARVIHNRRIREAFAARDRQRLLDAARPLYRELKDEYHITHLYLHEPDRINFLRLHTPERHGDRIERVTARSAQRIGRVSVGIELGPMGTYTLRAVAPWRHQGRLIGYVELGEELGELMGHLRESFGVGVVVAIAKRHLSREGWEAGMDMMGRSGSWGRLSETVLALNTMPGVADGRMAEVVERIPAGPGAVVGVPLNDRHYYLGAFPLEDIAGRSIGQVAVLRDMTERIQGTHNTIGVISGIAVIVGLGLLGLFSFILGRAETQLATWQGKVTDETRARLDAQRRHIRDLERAALYDPLSGLANRRLLDERINQAISAAADGALQFALYLVDVTRLREVNDTLGHDTGDTVLRQVAERLEGRFNGGTTIARLGGGEFALLLDEVEGSAIEARAGEIRGLFAAPFVIGDLTLHVDASIGVALHPEHGRDAAALMRAADVAMRQAKGSHRGFAVYDGARDPFSVRRLTLVGDLRKAIEEGGLRLHYQPQARMRDDAVVCIEALARWAHPEQGPVSPLEFIPLAEQTGLIRPLTFWVLNEALRQCSEWERDGLQLQMAVNLSTRNLLDPGLAGHIGELLAKWMITPQRLVLEITESALMLDPEGSLEVLQHLSDMGVCLSIDDFGTGYSSLAYLKRLPVDELKIDKSFVTDMLNHDGDGKIVASTVGLAHSLGLRVVAEGVETALVWKTLAGLDCERAQGRYLARPLPPQELAQWLQDRQRQLKQGTG